MNRTKSVKIRFSEEELNQINLRLPENIERAVWLRQLALGEPIQREKLKRKRKRAAPPKADPKLIMEIGRIGNNLNQIARWCNQHKSTTDVIQVVALLVKIEQELSGLINAEIKKNES